MRGKRCPYCHKFFSPNPKVRQRQRTCGRPSCQQALKGERNARWREENPDCCRGDYSRVKVWLDGHPGYLRRYRQSHPTYVEKNRQGQRLRDRREKVHLDIQAKIKREPAEIINEITEQSLSLSNLDIQDEIFLQPIEIHYVLSTLACLKPLDIQTQLDKSIPSKDNGLIPPGGQFHGYQKTPLSRPSSKDRRLLQLDRSPLCHRRVPP
jgi:hypothetical protein